MDSHLWENDLQPIPLKPSNWESKIEQIPTVGNQILMVSHFEIPNSGK